MLCEYLRHIDLRVVYEQLPNFEIFGSDSGLANIPWDISNRLAMHFEERAESTLEYLYGRPIQWRDMRPIDVAAEVGDFIERDIEVLEDICSTKAPRANSRLSAEKWLGKFNSFISDVLNTNGISDYYLIKALLLYQYDCLCWLHSRGDFTGALEVFEGITEATYMLSFCEMKSRQSREKSMDARELAARRHSKTNQQKAAVIAEWAASASEYQSRADFARIIGKRDGIKERTLYEWVAAYEKTKA